MPDESSVSGGEAPTSATKESAETPKTPPPGEEKPKSRSRRTFVKSAVIGGAAAAAVGAAWTFMSPTLRSSLVPLTPYGTFVIWFDEANSLYHLRNVATGNDDVASADGGRVLQDAISSLEAPSHPAGGEIWLSSNVKLPSSVITIDRSNISLIALRGPPPRQWAGPVPHVQKIRYTGEVNGGLLQGFHCREVEFDGTGGPQQMIACRDISMHVTGKPNEQGLRFRGGAARNEYIQYIQIDDLKTVLSGPSPSAIEFANSNGGTGHIIFTGITMAETEYDATGAPAVIKVATGAETGTPIQFEYVSAVDLPSRTQGDGLRPILMQSQSELGKGLRQMRIQRLFFEAHYAPQHTVVTIEPSTGPGSWFALTIDDLVISDAAGGTVNLIDNQNRSWMSREQYLRIASGAKAGVGTVLLGNPGLHEHFRMYLGEFSDLTPFGKLATPFTAGTPTSFVGPGGTSATPSATTDYVVAVTPIVVTSDAPWTLKDASGALVIETVPAGQARTVPIGYRVQFPSGTPSIFA